MIYYCPTDGTNLLDIIKYAIKICESLHKNKLQPFVTVKFCDIEFGVNEKSTIDNTLYEIYEQLKLKYEIQNGIKKPILHSGEYWFDYINKINFIQKR